jgi:hypothetical protein
MDSSDGRLVNNVSRHAVVIEPDERLREMLLAWKTRVAARWPSAAYVGHAPHSTVWAGDLTDEAGAGDALREAASRAREFWIDVHAPYVFYDDALTDGGHTCACAAVLTDDLARLQYAVSDVLCNYRPPAADGQLPLPLRREPFLRSWREYGFPFVGPHWIPHFTIASLPVRRDDAFIAEFLASSVSCRVAVRELSCWRVDGERHERVASLPLAPRVPERAGR